MVESAGGRGKAGRPPPAAAAGAVNFPQRAARLPAHPRPAARGREPWLPEAQE